MIDIELNLHRGKPFVRFNISFQASSRLPEKLLRAAAKVKNHPPDIIYLSHIFIRGAQDCGASPLQDLLEKQAQVLRGRFQMLPVG